MLRMICNAPRRSAMLALLSLWAAAPAATVGQWTRLPNAPDGISTMLMMTDGTVLAQSNGGSAWYRLTAGPDGRFADGTWSRRAPMHDTRLYYASTVLRDGRVFVGGGEYGTGGSSVEIYDPAVDTWSYLSGWSGDIGDSTGLTLADGRVLLLPRLWSSATVWNPVDGSWTETGGRPTWNDEESAALLADGSVLVTMTNGGSTRYLPWTNQWVDAGTPPDNLIGHGEEVGANVLMYDGRVLAIGASGATDLYANGTWSSGPRLPDGAIADDAPAAILPNGRVLVAGDLQEFGAPTEMFEFDPVTDSFTRAPTPFGAQAQEPVFVERFLVVPSGEVLFADGGSSVFAYTPTDGPSEAWRPAIATLAANGDGTAQLVGARLNGLSSGAYYGDDAQMASNFALVRMTDGSGTVRYARTFGFSTMGITPGDTQSSCEISFAGIPDGRYALAVVANGIASATVDVDIRGGAYGAGAVDGGTFAGASVPGTALQVGQGERVTVSMHNAGGTTWNVGAGYALVADDATWGVQSVALASAVPPGSDATFDFTIVAPPVPGTYAFQWRMAHAGARFGDASPALGIVVVPTDVRGDGTGLTGEYWSAQLAGFVGAPALTRVDPLVEFDWGGGSPDPAVSSDEFSARWSGQVLAPRSGMYDFSVIGDDGVRLWVNGQLIVDAWYDQGPTAHDGRIELQAGQRYEAKLEYYEHGGGAVARLHWTLPGSNESSIVPTAQLYPATVTSGGGTGLTAQYWSNQLAGFAGAPTVTRVDPTIDMDWGGGSPDPAVSSDAFTARWTGQVLPPTGGAWTFTVTGDDGVRLWIDGTLVVDAWFDESPTDHSATVQLSGGVKHDVRLDYFEHGGGAVARLWWQSATMPARAIVPQSALFPVDSGFASGTGLAGQYWSNQLATFAGAATVTRIDATVDFDWADRGPAADVSSDMFTARWTGQVLAPTTDTYTVTVTGDDGVRLWIGDLLVIDAWYDQSATAHSVAVQLTAGQRANLRLDFYEAHGSASVRLHWSTATMVDQAIPTMYLFPATPAIAGPALPTGNG